MEEEWRQIPGFENYQVSSQGRVRNTLNNQRALRKEPKILKHSESEDGYYRVGLCNGKGNPKLIFVHKLVALAFLSPVEDKLFIDHIDRNNKNNTPDNLRYVNLCEQNQNRGSKGTVSCGERNISLHKGLYQVSYQRFKIRVHKCFKTLKEAIVYRDLILCKEQPHSSP